MLKERHTMAAQALEQSTLESKDKDQLLQIAKALGVKGVSKLKKADLVDKIIDACKIEARKAAATF